MDNKEYNKRLKEIKAVMEQQILLLNEEFILTNTWYAVGDVITQEGAHIIQIESVKFSQGTKKPVVVYEGMVLNKDFTIKRDVYGYPQMISPQCGEIILLKKGKES
jgi:hypothetical protein